MASTRWILLFIVLILLFLTDLSLGSISIPFPALLNLVLGKETQEPLWATIFYDFRLPKALTCILAGSALSLGGLQMQTLFRNALAGPDVLGLTSGASLAVSLVYLGSASGIPFLNFSNPWTLAVTSSIGCAGIFLIILAFFSRLQDNVSLFIIGLMIGAGTSSIVSVLQFLSKAEDLQMFMIWTFGSLSSLDWSELIILGVLLLIGAVLAYSQIKSLNAWLLGPNYARSLGIDLRKARLLMILSTCLLAGGVTAFCGPIAFVGLAVPHLIRLLFKTQNHKSLIPGVMVGGAILLLFCDIMAQAPGKSQVLPINAITALVGAPVVIWVVLRNRIA
jgi:iron complex transport system permease protein